MTEEPTRPGLGLIHEHDRALRVTWQDRELFRYVYRPWDARVESPRPYLHPMWTLGGRLVSLYRPHDHVWHKGMSLALSNLGDDNFWGGPTYLRVRGGYAQLPNNGEQRHDGFVRLAVKPERVGVTERVTWVAESGRTVVEERRALDVTVGPAAWRLDVATTLHNVGDADLSVGSPETEGRAGAAYSGLFWRGPRSFSGGTVRTPDATGADDLNGVRARWMAFTGRHDGDGGHSTLLMVDHPDNPDHPTAWFVRSAVYAVLCPAPFATVRRLERGGALTLRYAVVVADGDLDRDACEELAT